MKMNEASHVCRELDREMNNVKPEIMRLQRLKTQYMMWLSQKGLTNEEINRRLAMRRQTEHAHTDKSEQALAVFEEIYGTSGSVREEMERLEQPQMIKPHEDKSLWFVGSISRAESSRRLQGKPNGTFLVRSRQAAAGDNHTHTIDIYFGSMKHIKVFQSPNGFGFSAPFDFPTLRDLIVHYSEESLEKHNPDLPTTLAYPINTV